MSLWIKARGFGQGWIRPAGRTPGWLCPMAGSTWTDITFSVASPKQINSHSSGASNDGEQGYNMCPKLIFAPNSRFS